MADIFDVANYILDKQGKMSAMKLQKLCYYSLAWSLVWDDPLFDNNFQAWTNGPVCKELFDMHKGRYILDKGDITGRSTLTDSQKETIDAVIELYGDKDPQWLSTLTHLEKPWNDARKGYADGENCTEVISRESMIDYYSSL